MKLPVRPSGLRGYTRPDSGPINIARFINQRVGGNQFRLQRSASERSDPVARDLLENPTARIARLDTPKPIPVEFSDKTLSELFQVKVPDPTDTVWIQERDRIKQSLIDGGENPAEVVRLMRGIMPFGRPQRTTEKTDNIASSNLNFTTKIDELMEEVVEHRNVDGVQRAVLQAQLAEAFQDTKAIMNLNERQLQELSNLVTKLGVAKSYADSGLPRVIDQLFYRENVGVINAYIIASVGQFSGLTAAKPIYGKRGSPIEFVSFAQAMNLSSQTTYFDMGTNTLLNRKNVLLLLDNMPESALQSSGVDLVRAKADISGLEPLSSATTIVPTPSMPIPEEVEEEGDVDEDEAESDEFRRDQKLFNTFQAEYKRSTKKATRLREKQALPDLSANVRKKIARDLNGVGADIAALIINFNKFRTTSQYEMPNLDD